MTSIKGSESSSDQDSWTTDESVASISSFSLKNAFASQSPTTSSSESSKNSVLESMIQKLTTKGMTSSQASPGQNNKNKVDCRVGVKRIQSTPSTTSNDKTNSLRSLKGSKSSSITQSSQKGDVKHTVSLQVLRNVLTKLHAQHWIDFNKTNQPAKEDQS